jgi:phospholipid transport system transporter-binding protein
VTEPQLRAVGDGQFVLEGPVTFATAGELLATSNELFAGLPELSLDLSGVTRVDSAALALLLEWLGQAQRDGRALRIHAIPDRLRSVARLTGTDDIIDACGNGGSSTG